MVKRKRSFLPLVSLGSLIFLLMTIGSWFAGTSVTIYVLGVTATILGLFSSFLPSRLARIEDLIDTHIEPLTHYMFISVAVCLALGILFHLSSNYRITIERKTS